MNYWILCSSSKAHSEKRSGRKWKRSQVWAFHFSKFPSSLIPLEYMGKTKLSIFTPCNALRLLHILPRCNPVSCWHCTWCCASPNVNDKWRCHLTCRRDFFLGGGGGRKMQPKSSYLMIFFLSEFTIFRLWGPFRLMRSIKSLN